MQTMQVSYKTILTLFTYFQVRYFSLSLLRMANRMHVGQKFEDFSAFESATRHYQNAENVQIYKQDPRGTYRRRLVTPVKQDTGRKAVPYTIDSHALTGKAVY